MMLRKSYESEEVAELAGHIEAIEHLLNNVLARAARKTVDIPSIVGEDLARFRYEAQEKAKEQPNVAAIIGYRDALVNCTRDAVDDGD